MQGEVQGQKMTRRPGRGQCSVTALRGTHECHSHQDKVVQTWGRGRWAGGALPPLSPMPLLSLFCKTPVWPMTTSRGSSVPHRTMMKMSPRASLFCFVSGLVHSTWKFPGQGLNLCHSSSSSHHSGNIRSLTHCGHKRTPPRASLSG